MIKSCFEEDFKKRSNARFWRDVSHRATTDDTKEAHTNSYLSSTLIFVSSRAKTNLIQTVVYQLSNKVLSINASIFVSWRARWVETTLTQTRAINSHTNFYHSILMQTLVYQFPQKILSVNSHLCFITSKVSRNNSYTHSYLATLIQVRTLLSVATTRVVHNSCVSRNNSCHARLWCESKHIDIPSIDAYARKIWRPVYHRVKCSHIGPTYT